MKVVEMLFFRPGWQIGSASPRFFEPMAGFWQKSNALVSALLIVAIGFGLPIFCSAKGG